MEPSAIRKPVLMVVEDNDALRHMLCIALQHQGFDVWVAANGQEALDIWRHHRDRVDLFLMDVQMDGLDGPETLTAIRAIDPHVRCGFMTGDAGQYTERELLDRGAAFVVWKPFELSYVAAALRRLLSRPIDCRPAA